MTGMLRLLYVEDEPDIREIVVMALGLDPLFDVSTAASGDEALTRLADESLAPDVILLDVMMPGIDGPTVLRQIRELSWLDDVAVIFVTARAGQAEQERFAALGVTGVITKPFDPMTLARQVRGILKFRD